MSVYGNNVEILEEQVILNEMLITKKDCEDPEKVKKILNKGFPTAGKAIAFCIYLLSSIIFFVSGLFTLGLGFLLFGEIYTSINHWYNDLDPRYKAKNKKKLIDKCNKIKEKCEQRLSKNPDDKDAKKLLDAVNKSLEQIKKFDEDVKNKKDAESYEKTVKAYKRAISNIENPSKFIDRLELGFILLLISEDEYKKAILDSEKKIKEKGKIINIWFVEDYDEYELMLNKSPIFKSIQHDDFIAVAGGDDNTVFLDIDKKMFVDFWTDNTCEKLNAKDYKQQAIEDFGLQNIKQVDRVLGYYRLSEPPKGINPIPIKNIN